MRCVAIQNAFMLNFQTENLVPNNNRFHVAFMEFEHTYSDNKWNECFSAAHIDYQIGSVAKAGQKSA